MLQLNELETTIRREVDMRIGEGMYTVLTNGSVQAAIESIPQDTDPFEAEQYMHMVVLGAAHPEQPIWRMVLPVMAQAALNGMGGEEARSVSFNRPIATTMNRLGLGSSEKPEVKELMDGLLVEALEDSLFWTDVIKRTEGLPANSNDTLKHPTIIAATSLNHTVHRVVKEVMKQHLLSGLQPVVPRSKEDFIGLYHLAPRLLGSLGLKLEVETRETRSAEKSGFCPAKARDAALEQSWLEALQKISGKFYYKFFREEDYIR